MILSGPIPNTNQSRCQNAQNPGLKANSGQILLGDRLSEPHLKSHFNKIFIYPVELN